MTRATDVVVVGAGPAGSAAAITFARGGASVLLVDRSPFPRWKVCGACLSPGSQSSLRDLGIDELGVAGAVPLRTMLLHTEGKTARLRLNGWKVLSREALDAMLVRRAVRMGVKFWTEARARLGAADDVGRAVTVTHGGDEVTLRARVVLDATGLGRGLSEDAAATSEPVPEARVGLGAVLDAPTYPVGPGALHMAVARQGYVGLVRVESGLLNVAAAVDAPILRTSTPEKAVMSILNEAGLPSLPSSTRYGWRGTPALTRSAPVFGSDRLLHLGDAAGYVEPFTGEGIGWALGDGRAAAEIARGALSASHFDRELAAWSQYRTARRQSRERLCRLFARGLRHPWMVRLAVSSLRIAPRIAAPLLRRAERRPLAPPVEAL